MYFGAGSLPKTSLPHQLSFLVLITLSSSRYIGLYIPDATFHSPGLSAACQSLAKVRMSAPYSASICSHICFGNIWYDSVTCLQTTTLFGNSDFMCHLNVLSSTFSKDSNLSNRGSANCATH